MLGSQQIFLSPDLIIMASFAVYMIALWRMALNGMNHFDHLNEYKVPVYKLLIASTVLLGLSLAGEIYILFEVNRGARLDQSVALLIALTLKLLVVGYIVTSALQRPSNFDWIYTFGLPSRITSLPDETLASHNEHIAAFETFLKTANIAEQHMPLKKVATLLGVQARPLSEAINYVYGESYSRYMNRLRVRGAKRLLEQHPNMAMIDIMFNSGFRTKSSFNKEFRSITRMSPTDYRSKMSEN